MGPGGSGGDLLCGPFCFCIGPRAPQPRPPRDAEARPPVTVTTRQIPSQRDAPRLLICHEFTGVCVLTHPIHPEPYTGLNPFHEGSFQSIQEAQSPSLLPWGRGLWRRLS